VTSDPIIVERVIDGDTVQMPDGERVRLIGIDTPEVDQCGSLEATAKLRELVEGKPAPGRSGFSPK